MLHILIRYDISSGFEVIKEKPRSPPRGEPRLSNKLNNQIVDDGGRDTADILIMF